MCLSGERGNRCCSVFVTYISTSRAAPSQLKTLYTFIHTTKRFKHIYIILHLKSVLTLGPPVKAFIMESAPATKAHYMSRSSVRQSHDECDNIDPSGPNGRIPLFFENTMF